MNELFRSALPIIYEIENAGFEAYFVGGSVRDHLLGRSINDVDIASSATPSELKKIFPNTVDVGIEHGTILVIYKGTGYEITTFRSESDYVQYRRPESVTFIRSLHEDLKRRDFTMNAIAMDSNGKMIDPFNGQADILKKKIVTVGDAAERFQEDALRLMRAIRFVSQLGFELDAETEASLASHSPLLEHIAVERVSAEMVKLLSGSYKEKAMELALQTRLYTYLPSIFNDEQLIRTLRGYRTELLNETDMWILSLFVAGSEQPIEQLKKWRLPARKMKYITKGLALLQWRMEHDWNPYEIYQSGKELSLQIEAIYQAIHLENKREQFPQIETCFNRLPITSRHELDVSGNDLLQWINQPGGPWVSELLSNIERAVVNREIPNEKNSIRRWVENCRLPLENN